MRQEPLYGYSGATSATKFDKGNFPVMSQGAIAALHPVNSYDDVLARLTASYRGELKRVRKECRFANHKLCLIQVELWGMVQTRIIQDAKHSLDIDGFFGLQIQVVTLEAKLNDVIFTNAR